MFKREARTICLLALSGLLAGCGCGGGAKVTCKGSKYGSTIEIVAVAPKMGDPVQKARFRATVKIKDVLGTDEYDKEDVKKVEEMVRETFRNDLGIPEEDFKFSIKGDTLNFEALINNASRLAEEKGNEPPVLDLEDMRNQFEGDGITCN